MITVHSKQQPYDVHVGAGVIEGIARESEGYARVAIIFPAHLPALADAVAAKAAGKVVRIAVPDAEAAKTPAVLQRCWETLANAGFTRSDLVVGVGGGAATDLAGFVAATWLRGVAYISVPTSVLAMVDAAVGGKTSINLEVGKNLVGAFYEPRAVFCDFDFLSTLPVRELRSGMAEVVKCGFIKDPVILELASQRDRLDVAGQTFSDMVRRAIAVKAEVVATDLREATSVGDRVGREALNYGHTLGHAIETTEHYTWRHGEAISVGMAWIARVSRQCVGLSDDVVALHDELLHLFRLPRAHDGAYAALRHVMSLDKKSRGNNLRLVCLRDIAQPTVVEAPDEAVLQSCYDDLS